VSLQLPDAVLTREVALIGERIAALQSAGDGRREMADQLRVIAAHLRLVAQDDPSVACHLCTLLGTDSTLHP
jgi:hypothetical protein